MLSNTAFAILLSIRKRREGRERMVLRLGYTKKKEDARYTCVIKPKKNSHKLKMVIPNLI